MTHDELLSRIDSKQQDYYADDQSLNALRAVVQLHTSEFDCLICAEADGPCPTIQKIMDELK
jgi:hypothetical protein